PGDLVDELRRFARRRPGAFLMGALAAGVVAGRLGRGVVAAHTEDDGTAAGAPTNSGPGDGRIHDPAQPPVASHELGMSAPNPPAYPSGQQSAVADRGSATGSGDFAGPGVTP
ncbi:MAG TPA: hypothetical protein VKB75_00770, partial [Jatrophihabitans sp.]|nr:hypothetical protein [Jatrophihabitans sp.]